MQRQGRAQAVQDFHMATAVPAGLRCSIDRMSGRGSYFVNAQAYLMYILIQSKS